jgi:hypothetical protein
VFHGAPPEGIDVTLEVRGEGPLPDSTPHFSIQVSCLVEASPLKKLVPRPLIKLDYALALAGERLE